MPVTHVALLRGINVGGRNKLPMAELRALLGDLGMGDVQTLIQSGNVLFSSDRTSTELKALLAEQIEARFGFPVPVAVRTAAELHGILEANPFQREPEVLPEHLHVGFLVDPPVRTELDAGRSPGDRAILVQNHLFLHLPNGMGRTKLTSAWLDKQLGTVVTVRNWTTLGRLLECTPAMRG